MYYGEETRRRISFSTNKQSYELYCNVLGREMIAPRRASVYARPSSGRLTLDSLPVEILDNIASYCCGSPEGTVIVKRRPSTTFHQSDLTTGAVRKCWTAAGYPTNLLLVNRAVHDAVSSALWRRTTFILSLSSSDALCFLKYALSDRQRSALRCIRLTRFMLSWEDAIGDDIWLAAHKREPAFHRALEPRPCPTQPRVVNLVAHLQSRHPAIMSH